MFRRIVLLCTVVTLGLVMLGAYVRLADAGLGCPDWPGCYGKLTPTLAHQEIAAAVQEQGGTHGPVSMPKAWKEMVHRYIASALGMVIFGLMVASWFNRQQRHPVLTTSLFAVVCLQGAFGAWTVTMLLKPAIVTGHLIGGMTVLGMLTWLTASLYPSARTGRVTSGLRLGGALVFAALAVQIILGGWVSTNYAALACPDFPTCRASWSPPMNYEHAFHVFRELGKTSAGESLPVEALTAIHWTHRIGALLVTLLVSGYAAALYLQGWTRHGGLLALALIVQVSLGIITVLLSLPLPLAVLHNGGAAVLVMLMTTIHVRMAQVASGAHQGAMRSLFVQGHRAAWNR